MKHLQILTLVVSFFAAFASKDVLEMDGDIILGGLFPIHNVGSREKECGSIDADLGYQYMEAMLYTIDNINKRQEILPGIKLGTILYDTCRSAKITGHKTKEFISRALSNTTKLAGVIGPLKSDNTIQVANFLRVFQIPQISYSSLTDELSNKNIYNYFFRTVAPDSFFARALAELLKRIGWSYVSIVYSEDKWAEAAEKEVEEILEKEIICLGKIIRVPSFASKSDFDQIISSLLHDTSPSVVVMVTIPHESRRLLKAMKRNPRGHQLTLVGSLLWGNTGAITEGLGEVADGTITFGHQDKQIPEFKKYFEGLSFNNYNRSNKVWIGEYWQDVHRCKLKNFPVPTTYTARCSGDEENTVYKKLASVKVVINAVQAMANALHNLHQQLCPGAKHICKKMRPLPRELLLKFLKNVTFEDAAFHYPLSFNANQEVNGNYTVYNFRWSNNSFKYVDVGSWVGRLDSSGITGSNLFLDPTKLRWAGGNETTVLSTCRPFCRRNEIRRLWKWKGDCCWECKRCSSRSIIINNTCERCEKGYQPNSNLSTCVKRALKFVNVDTPLAITLAVLSCLGILADCVSFVTFFLYRHHQLVKASGREMCYIMFLGIGLVFATSLIRLLQPTQTRCYATVVTFGVSMTICYAPLLMKLWRIHGIFKSAHQLKRLSSGSRFHLRSMLLLVFGLIAIQGLFCWFMVSAEPPHLIENLYQERHQLVLECKIHKEAFVVYFTYNALLLLSCTVYACLTRNFPKNFNEARYIGITMYLTCIIWIVFFATFLNNDEYSITGVYWSSGAILVIGWVTLLGLFAPKFYQLYTKKEFSREMLIKWDHGNMVSKAERPEALDTACENCEHCKQRRAELIKNGSETAAIKTRHDQTAGLADIAVTHPEHREI